jgi:hypothetical protein
VEQVREAQRRTGFPCRNDLDRPRCRAVRVGAKTNSCAAPKAQRDPPQRPRALAAQHRVALGNAPKTPLVMAALESRRKHASPVVREHVEWALRQHTANEAP